MDSSHLFSVSCVQDCGRGWGCSREQDNHRLVLVLPIVLRRELDNDQITTQILTDIVKVSAMKVGYRTFDLLG